MQTILLALIAGLLVLQMVSKTDGGREVWAEYIVLLAVSAVIFGIAFGLNALAIMFGLSL